MTIEDICTKCEFRLMMAMRGGKPRHCPSFLEDRCELLLVTESMLDKKVQSAIAREFKCYITEMTGNG